MTKLHKLADAGLDFDELLQRLLDEGVAAFAQSFENLMQSIEEKRNVFRAGTA